MSTAAHRENHLLSSIARLRDAGLSRYGEAGNVPSVPVTTDDPSCAAHVFRRRPRA